MENNSLFHVSQEFKVDAELLSVEQNEVGQLNGTYVCNWQDVKKEKFRTILQEINQYVFVKPEILDKNFTIFSRFYHSAKTATPVNLKIPELIETKTGHTMLVLEGSYWRMQKYIENSICIEKPESLKEVLSATEALASFHLKSLNFPINNLTNPIPGFQEVVGRVELLKKAMKEDSVSRLSLVKPEIKFIENYIDVVKDYMNLYSSCPLRVTHGDPKFNNFLFNKDTREAFALIDFDSLMPGHFFYDFGDFIRGLSIKAKDDETSADKLGANIEFAKSAMQKYFSNVNTLDKLEKESLLLAPLVIAFSLGTRFLTDYLIGDLYFKTKYSDQNLYRSRVQLALIKDFELLAAELCS